MVLYFALKNVYLTISVKCCICSEGCKLEKYYTELYFYENKDENKGLTDTPNLDEYSKSVVVYDVIATSWENAKNKIINKYPDVAYIHTIETRKLDM